MIARICKCCGGPLEPTQLVLCVTCISGEPLESEPEQIDHEEEGDGYTMQVEDEILKRKGIL